ncbi:MAG: glycosyltransferase family 2 protein [Chloroflexi bacterium]|nr:glycosyltransferase family 2 protein [Chloroflexota bacterium]
MLPAAEPTDQPEGRRPQGRRPQWQRTERVGTSPAAVVIIPNWNGARLLRICLDSLRQQRWQDFETIVVDNGSTDDSLAVLAREYPEARVIPLDRNYGLAIATNVGIRASDAEIVVTLNNDIEAHPDWLAELVGALQATPEAGSAASKMLLFDRRDHIHSAGDFYRLDGVPGNRGVWERDDGRYDRPELIFGACAGAAAYRRSMLEDVGLFDESLFMYCEDVDLAFRSQLLGYRCVYVPSAVVYHMLSATGGGPTASYYCGRNFLRVLMTNMPGPLLRRWWPRIALAQLRIAGEALRHVREPSARARLRGQLAGLRALPCAWSARRAIQSRRRVPLRYLQSIMATP